ncbi:PHA/PHB synthase family protein [Pseudonocardia sp. TRM90224]|uniref:PHA/PHB synthase family protein n=1 Tax=Pseudonocardia sp. TRM90224 TaxID=2812678 RepID=UPI001E38DE14|nr:alpha/beta fold hydrolase [Pseudonocardia sp. TRM90224]
MNGAGGTPGLDAVLAGGARGPLRAVLPGRAGFRLLAALAAQPVTVVGRGAGLLSDLLAVAAGRSPFTPGGPRHTHPAWTTNPLLRRLVQAHAATARTATDLLADAELDPADHQRVAAALRAALAAVAPGNGPLHPEVLQAAMATGGGSLARGAMRMAADLSTAPRVPSAVEADACEVGVDVAATPGAVVLRTPTMELIQYLPQTEVVRAVPLLVVAPIANRFYVADLAPDHSIVEQLVRGGQQVFAISWRNPDRTHATWDLDTYCQAVLDAMDACERITRAPTTSLMGFGAGGLIAATVTGHLSAIAAADRVASLTLVATTLDHGDGPLEPGFAEAAASASAAVGYLDGPTLAEVDAWLRADELIWPHWVRGHLCGRAAEPSAELFWRADATRVPAGLHRDLVDVAARNPLVAPGAMSVLGTAIDLSKVDRDCYVITTDDPVTGWEPAYRSTQLLGGPSRFVLAEGERSYRALDAGLGVPPSRLAAVRSQQGTWWGDHAAWLADRSGEDRDAPPELGGRGLHALAPAPGQYVLAR